MRLGNNLNDYNQQTKYLQQYSMRNLNFSQKLPNLFFLAELFKCTCISNITGNRTGYPCYHLLIVSQLFRKSFAIVATLYRSLTISVFHDQFPLGLHNLLINIPSNCTFPRLMLHACSLHLATVAFHLGSTQLPRYFNQLHAISLSHIFLNGQHTHHTINTLIF